MGVASFELGPWPKGMFALTDERNTPVDALQLAMNVDVNIDGSVTRRRGCDVQYLSAAGQAWDIWEWDVSDPDYKAVIIREGNTNYVLRRLGGATYDTISAASVATDYIDYHHWDYVSLGDADQVYCVHGWGTTGANRLQWNGIGSAVTNATMAKADFAIANPDAGTASNMFPSARHGLVKHERVFVANVKYSGGSEFPSRVHFSDLLKPEAWYADFYIDVDPEHEGQITALVDYGDAILVFKEKAIYMLTGSSLDTFALTKLIDGYGASYRNQIAVDGANVYFISPAHGVVRFNGEGFERIDLPVSNELDDAWWGNYSDRVAYNEGRLYVSSYITPPLNSGMWGTYVYDTVRDRWWVYDFSMVAGATLGGTFYFSPSVNGVPGGALDGIFAFVADQDDDTWGNVDAEIATGQVSPAGPGVLNRTKRVDVQTGDIPSATSSAYGDIRIIQQQDYSASTGLYQDVTLSDTDRYQRVDGFGRSRWETVRYRVQNVSGSAFTVSKLVARFVTGRRGRGTD